MNEIVSFSFSNKIENIFLKTKVENKRFQFFTNPFEIPLSRIIDRTAEDLSKMSSTIATIMCLVYAILPMIVLLELTVGNLCRFTLGNFMIACLQRKVTESSSYKWSPLKIALCIFVAYNLYKIAW